MEIRFTKGKRKKNKQRQVVFRQRMSFFLCIVLVLLIIFPETNLHAYEESTLSYQDIDFDFSEEELEPGIANCVKEVTPFSLVAETQSSLPVAYNINEKGEVNPNLPSMKNQGNYGNCWAFSALGASETNLMKKGYADQNIDLSERHLTYYFYSKGAETTDPLGGTYGDYNTTLNSSSDYWGIGGNSLLTIWHLASWCGPVLEEKAPFASNMKQEDRNGLLGQPNSTQMAYESDAFHLENAYVIPIGESYKDATQRDCVKKLIMEYGALGMSYYSQKTPGEFDNVKNDCYYNDQYTSTNHAIQVVGWDDRFSRENFNEDHRPEADGAWLMKNSWGEESDLIAQNGYFWLSYYDYSLRNASGSTTKYAYVYDCGPSDNFDQIYQHDGEAGHKRFGNEKGQYYGLSKAANIFEVRNNQEKDEYLEAVSIGESREGIPYSLKIYTQVGDNGPTDGTLVHTQEGVIEYNGYHTILLDQSVKLERGSRFSIVFEFQDTAYVYASRSFSLSPWKFVSNNNQGQSYFMLSSANQWEDCASNSKTAPQSLRIKGFTRYAQTPVFNDEQITLSQEGQTSIVSVTTVSENALGEKQDVNYEWNSSNEEVAKVHIIEGTNGSQARIEAVGEGVCRITARLLSGSYVSKDLYVCVQKLNSEEYSIWGSNQQPDPNDSQNEPSDPNKDLEDPNKPNEPNKPDDLNRPNEPSSTTDDILKQPDEKDEENGPAILTGLKLNYHTISLQPGGKKQLVSKPSFSPGRENEWMVYWKSSDISVATVNEYGQVYAKKIGKCTIQVYNGTVSDSCVINVIPEKVTDIRIGLKEKEKAKLSWEKKRGVDGYQIYRAKASDGTYKKIKTITNGNKVSFLTNGFYTQDDQNKAYYFKVRAFKTIGGVKYLGVWSNIKTLEPAKSQITKLKKISAKAVSIRFADVKHADGYRIYRRKKANSNYEVVGIISNKDKREFVDHTVRRGNTYYYKVRAFRLVNGKRVYGPKSERKKVRI